MHKSYTHNKGEKIKEASSCRHCGETPYYKVSYDDPQVSEWHRISCLEKKCPVNPHELAMNSKDAVLNQWNKRMGCKRCKEHESLLMMLNGRLDAAGAHTDYTREKMADHYGLEEVETVKEMKYPPGDYADPGDLKGTIGAKLYAALSKFKCPVPTPTSKHCKEPGCFMCRIRFMNEFIEGEGALIHNREHNYTLKDNEDTLWLTVGDLSVEIKRRDDGVSASLLPLGDEADGPILDAAFAYFSAGRKSTQYCDHCGEPLKKGKFVAYTNVPYDVASANEGESAVVCLKCDKGHFHLKAKLPTKVQPPTGERLVVCNLCGDLYDEAKGDGYCGLCPKCADETEPCHTCKRKAGEDYTIGCPECLEHEHAATCKKCETPLKEGLCQDVTCPYSDRKQHEEYEEG